MATIHGQAAELWNRLQYEPEQIKQYQKMSLRG